MKKNSDIKKTKSGGHVGSGWVLASNNPPVYHPQGLENPDYTEGKWVATFGPEARWFIPDGGVNGRSERQLEEEANRLRTRFQNTRGTLRKTGRLAADSADWGIKTGFSILVEIAAGVGGP